MLGLSAWWQLMAVLVMSVLPVQVTTTGGQKVQGDLVQVTAETLELQVDGQTRSFPFDDLASLKAVTAEEKTGPLYLVTLVGGSRIAAGEVALSGSEVVISPRRQSPLTVPVKEVKAIRFRAAATATDAAWLGIVQQPSRGDTLVIRRPGDRLDPAIGVIEAISDGKVTFNLEGDAVDAPIERLEGLVFGGTAAVNENADIQVDDLYGSTWALTGLGPSAADQPLQMQLNDSLRHSLPLDQLGSIRFSGGLALLASETPAASKFQPYVQTGVAAELLDSFFGARVEDQSDLVLHGGSSLEYRIPPGYQTLAGTVTRAAGIDQASKVIVRIQLDGKTLWEESLDDATPRGIELPVAEARRLTIEVDSGDDGDLGDTVRIARPRFLK